MSSDRASAILWILLPTAASIATTLALACATPFAALAAIAAVHLRRQDGVPLILLAWGTSQAIGFGLLGYPRDATTLAWGLGLGLAAAAALFAGYEASERSGLRSGLVRAGIAYLAAFVAFKAVLAICALGLGGLAVALSPTIMVTGFVRDGAILVGLLVLYRGLVAIGVPAAPARLKAA